MFFAPVVLSFALASVKLVAAQNSTASNNTALGIEAIEAHFSQAGLVPSLLATFNPSAVLTLSYSGVGDVSPGQALTQQQVQPVPGLSVTPANSSVEISGTYTIVMADAGPVGTDESQGQTRHWLVNGATISNGSSPLNVSTDSGVAITKYGGPAPAAGSGPHRYAILLFAQPNSFKAPDGLNTAGTPISVFNLQDYVKNSGLGAVVAGTYITVANGADNSSIPATSAVVSSTLSAPQATGSGNSTTKASGSGSGSSGAPSPTGSSSAAGMTIASVQNVFIAALAGLFFL
ncbi:phosphatidylethanolamine-binding protein [Irpex rosettiformis]|uniref:Phosphatidylethanolamine-binding protein n=1 Tax=Irpex rosettiformis TaxID=378272 RepID=A0ACB8UJ49_9APHY|nr:phosphatidylethanolamine-binding protein [Irpex rosettiformis]